MVTLVVMFNLLLALLCLLAIWQVWQLRRRLAQVADSLIGCEQRIQAVLSEAPAAISQGQQGTRHLQQQLQQLQLQFLRWRQILSLVRFGLGLWQGRGRANQFRR